MRPFVGRSSPATRSNSVLFPDPLYPKEGDDFTGTYLKIRPAQRRCVSDVVAVVFPEIDDADHGFSHALLLSHLMLRANAWCLHHLRGAETF